MIHQVKHDRAVFPETDAGGHTDGKAGKNDSVNEPAMTAVELHSHLYGCLNIEDLYWLAGRNLPGGRGREQLFIESYQRLHGHSPEWENLFLPTEESRRLLRTYYHKNGSSSFAAFQNSFDLIIALSTAEPEELQQVLHRVVATEEASRVEYRMMFAPDIGAAELEEKATALAEETDRIDRSRTDKDVRLIISLRRDPEKTWGDYEIVRRIQKRSPAAARSLVGVDFCHIEEGYPPADKGPFFQQLLADNEAEPERALAILYHVGESYTDKTVESAVRWVLQAAYQGAHRLGHAIAPGIRPDFFLGSIRTESVLERLAQLRFEEEHEAELRRWGYNLDLSRDGLSIPELNSRRPDERVSVTYDQKRVLNLECFQEWAMAELAGTKAVIESCPLSNLVIACQGEPDNHPLPRFLRNRLPVVIATDDRGIFNTSLSAEFRRIQSWPGISTRDIAGMQYTATISGAELLSGRGRTVSKGVSGEANHR